MTFRVCVKRVVGVSAVSLDGVARGPSDPAYQIEVVNPHGDRLLIHEPFYECPEAVDHVAALAKPWAQLLQAEIVWSDYVSEPPVVEMVRPWFRPAGPPLVGLVAEDNRAYLVRLLLEFEQRRERVAALIRTAASHKVSQRGFIDVIEDDAGVRHYVVARWLDEDVDDDWADGVRLIIEPVGEVFAIRVPWSDEAAEEWHGKLFDGFWISRFVDLDGRFCAVCYEVDEARRGLIREFVAKHGGDWLG